jgi:hypothetical protein
MCDEKYRATGGGFSSGLKDQIIKIIVSEPFIDLNGNATGWHVVGIPTIEDIVQFPPILNAYAICAQIEK